MKAGKSFETIDMMEENEKTEDDKEELKRIDKFLSEQKLFCETVKTVFFTVMLTFYILLVLWLLVFILVILHYRFPRRSSPKKLGDMFCLFSFSIAGNLIIWCIISAFLYIRFSSRWFKWKYLMVLIGIILPVSVYIVYVWYPILDEEFPNDQLLVHMILIAKLLWILTAVNIAFFTLAYYKTMKINNSLFTGKGSYRVIYGPAGSSSKKREEGEEEEQW